MDDRFNTAAGWVLFAGIVALGSSIASSLYFHADKPEHSEKMGYFIEGGDEGAEGGEAAYDLGTLLAAADPAAGEKLFAKCSTCHTYNQGGANGIGPNLWAVLGSPIGSHAPGFAYSAALKEKGGTWDYAAMDAWLKSPKAFAPGTKMSFAGLSKPEDRASLMAFMKAHGGGPEFPAPKAADAAAEGAPAAGATPGAEATPGREGGPNAPVEGAPVSDTAAAGGASADQPIPTNQRAPRNSGDKPGEGN
ncbi:c-type cytochrome [Qipengyuania sediminis]|uniref:c-type cytochrome n=1 Tax=Qipengyuania sediminis TaxID=1532023 RepID=UPI00105A633E|nr:cytochrome c family protein [Qipengyuania sediminis]